MRALKFEVNETVTLRYQVKEEGVAKDITGMTFTFAAKERPADAAYRISPLSGTIDDAQDGRFSITLTVPPIAFAGFYSIVMEDALGKRTVLTRRGGTDIKVLESLLNEGD